MVGGKRDKSLKTERAATVKESDVVRETEVTS